MEKILNKIVFTSVIMIIPLMISCGSITDEDDPFSNEVIRVRNPGNPPVPDNPKNDPAGPDTTTPDIPDNVDPIIIDDEEQDCPLNAIKVEDENNEDGYICCVILNRLERGEEVGTFNVETECGSLSVDIEIEDNYYRASDEEENAELFEEAIEHAEEVIEDIDQDSTQHEDLNVPGTSSFRK